MLRGIGKLVQYFLVAANILIVVALVLCSYTYRLNSHDYPDYSYWGMFLPIFLCASIFFLFIWLVIKRRFMLISIVGMLICADSIRDFFPVNFSSKIPEGAFKVLSYNVMGFGDVRDVPWDENIVLGYIRESGADIVCIQEMENIPEATLHQLCDSIYPYIGIDTIKPMLHLLLLSKYPIISSERINYESSTNGSFAHKVVKGNDTILVVNNHMESYKLQAADKDNYKSIIENPEGEDNEEKYDSLITKLKAANYIRATQADSIAKYIVHSDSKYVLCMGDFNAPVNSYTHYRLTRLLNDAYTRSGCGVGFSYNRSGMYFRIDNILTSENIKAYNAKVDAYSKMSDHFPIYAWLELQP